MLQARNKQGRINNKFQNLSDIEVFLNAADYYRPSTTWLYVESNPVTVRAEIAPLNSDNYTPLNVESYAANNMMPIWGDGYKLSLGEYNEKSATGWFQLRLTLTDATGNKCVQTISPALYAESAKSGVAGVKEDAFGISLQGNTLFISSADAAAVEIYSISGTLVKQATGNEIDLSALPAGVYVVRAAAAGSVVTEKICVR